MKDHYDKLLEYEWVDEFCGSKLVSDALHRVQALTAKALSDWNTKLDSQETRSIDDWLVDLGPLAKFRCFGSEAEHAFGKAAGMFVRELETLLQEALKGLEKVIEDPSRMISTEPEAMFRGMNQTARNLEALCKTGEGTEYLDHIPELNAKRRREEWFKEAKDCLDPRLFQYLDVPDNFSVKHAQQSWQLMVSLGLVHRRVPPAPTTPRSSHPDLTKGLLEFFGEDQPSIQDGCTVRLRAFATKIKDDLIDNPTEDDAQKFEALTGGLASSATYLDRAIGEELFARLRAAAKHRGRELRLTQMKEWSQEAKDGIAALRGLSIFPVGLGEGTNCSEQVRSVQKMIRSLAKLQADPKKM